MKTRRWVLGWVAMGCLFSAMNAQAQWVMVARAVARKREVKEGKRVLFPVRLVGFEGSAQESDEVRILSGFLERDEFGLGSGQTLRLQQQVVEIAIAATTTQ